MSSPTIPPLMTTLCHPLGTQSPSQLPSPRARPSLKLGLQLAVAAKATAQTLPYTARSRRVEPRGAGTVGSLEWGLTRWGSSRRTQHEKEGEAGGAARRWHGGQRNLLKPAGTRGTCVRPGDKGSQGKDLSHEVMDGSGTGGRASGMGSGGGQHL